MKADASFFERMIYLDKIRKYFTVLNDYEVYCQNFNAKEWDFDVYTDFEMKRTGMTYYR